MSRPIARLLAYYVLERLRDNPRGMSTRQLAAQLLADESNTHRALYWLRDVGAPIVTRVRGRRRPRVLTDLEWRIPFESLDAQCKIFELERTIKPGDATDLLECVLRMQRDNFALHARLQQKVA